jgi:hypothetical protein
MPLTAADLPTLGNTPITIRSTFFPNVYLRMDGTGVPTTGASGGTVNCQYTAGPYEKFKLRPQADGSYSVESVAFPNVYLRMDGTGVPTTGAGGGTVNCHFNANGGSNEKFKLRAQANGSFSFESTAIANIYLRMVASGLTARVEQGGGTVNCQVNANGGAHETFILNLADQRLDFVMQDQQQTNWCWSACTVSVERYYNPASGLTQCDLVNTEFGRNDCCNAGGSAACNQGNWPQTPMTRLGRLHEDLRRSLTVMQVAAELANSAPFIADILWQNGAGSHVLAVHGRSQVDGTEYVTVADPWYGNSVVAYNTFLNQYQGIGTWRYSYTTKR